jgi:lysyl-tRNA synthetase class 2
MRPEKKAPDLSENEKVILGFLKQQNPMPLSSLKEKAGLSNKAWDKGIKGLNAHGLVKVVKEGENLLCTLQ